MMYHSRNKQINHARNIWDRAITILPRATQFWLKYSYMEELIENIPGARQVLGFFVHLVEADFYGHFTHTSNGKVAILERCEQMSEKRFFGHTSAVV